MFMGEYQHSIDAKGRLIVPAKFRDGLGEHFVVTKGLDNCLFAYPQEEWKIFEEKLKQLPLTSTGARKFVRFFFAGAVECDLDNQMFHRIFSDIFLNVFLIFSFYLFLLLLDWIVRAVLIIFVLSCTGLIDFSLPLHEGLSFLLVHHIP